MLTTKEILGFIEKYSRLKSVPELYLGNSVSFVHVVLQVISIGYGDMDYNQVLDCKVLRRLDSDNEVFVGRIKVPLLDLYADEGDIDISIDNNGKVSIYIDDAYHGPVLDIQGLDPELLKELAEEDKSEFADIILERLEELTV